MARISFFILPLFAAAWLWLPIPARCAGDGESRIVLVRATTSAPNEAERNFAQSIARRLSRWLADMDVPHQVIDDDKLSPRRSLPPRS